MSGLGYNALVRHNTLQRVQRYVLIVTLVAIAGLGLLGARIAGVDLPGMVSGSHPGFERSAFNRQIALISGHAGNDSGAVCEDDNGSVTLTEADINATVAKMAGDRLRQAGTDVLILEEFDPRLDGLKVDVLLSIHADSCIDASGYKAATYANSAIQATDDILLTCIDQNYSAATQLPHHPNTVTHNMTEYHAFRQIDPTTPAAILELGFLGGDRDLLENRPGLLAQGVTESLLCFLRTQQ